MTRDAPHHRRAGLSTAIVVAITLPLSLGTTAHATLATTSRPVVTYREEGGLGGPKASVTVQANREATVTVTGGRTPASPRETRLRLGARTWRKFLSALRRADLPALAHDHATRGTQPDAITYVIRAGHNTVAATDGAMPKQLEPLVETLRELGALGKGRLEAA